jgi:hypothetical protein
MLSVSVTADDVEISRLLDAQPATPDVELELGVTENITIPARTRVYRSFSLDVDTTLRIVVGGPGGANVLEVWSAEPEPQLVQRIEHNSPTNMTHSAGHYISLSAGEYYIVVGENSGNQTLTLTARVIGRVHLCRFSSSV